MISRSAAVMSGDHSPTRIAPRKICGRSATSLKDRAIWSGRVRTIRRSTSTASAGRSMYTSISNVSGASGCCASSRAARAAIDTPRCCE
jgi:hypothetical protein